MLRFTVLLTFLLSVSAQGQTLSGVIRVVDADTFWVDDAKVRLHGIDAPEGKQTCTLKDGSPWACGRWATEQARGLYQGKTAVCAQTDTDRYGRMVVRCKVEGRDVGADLVYAGIARAFQKYSREYVDLEKKAMFSGRGTWRASMQSPADFRAESRLALPAPDASCAIKGNISGGGKIYHMPGQADYSVTKINNSKGERWFCSEAEAMNAGWRRAKR
jgi:endonuclease YncB( thermonuclease family)